MISSTYRLRFLGPAMLVLSLAGCARQSAVSGRVTYEGRPVQDGYITFYPTEQQGVSLGSEIKEGRYEVADLLPGKKRVRIVANPRPVVIPASAGKPQIVKLAPPAAPIPANAVGNDQVLEVP